MNKLIIGSHVSLSGPEYLVGSVNEALGYDANTFMIYTGAPQNTIRKDTSTFKIEQAHKLMQENNIDINNVIVHAPYIINLCSENIETRKLAREFLIKELDRVHEMGFTKLVLHPGCKLKQDLNVAIEQIADGINNAFIHSNNNVSILLETMAGKGSEVGHQTSDIVSIINLVENKQRIGVCLDTCHISDSGIDLDDFEQYINDFDQTIGIDRIKCIHVNDSMNIVNARKDRHQNLGYGKIGFDKLLKVIYHPKLISVPKILETPYVEENGVFKAPYKKEIDMIRNKHFDDWKKFN